MWAYICKFDENQRETSVFFNIRSGHKHYYRLRKLCRQIKQFRKRLTFNSEKISELLAKPFYIVSLLSILLLTITTN